MKSTPLFVLLSLINFVLGCPRDCSNHGVCTNDACVCNTGYTGSDCSIQLDTLESGVQVNGTISAWEWHYYQISNSKKGSALKVEVSPIGLLGDCDTYVRKSELPTSTVFDKSDTDWGTTASIILENIDTATYYIGVYASFMRCRYNIKATITEGRCPKGCGHGTCVTYPNKPNGTCECETGWSGETCSVEVPSTPLQLGTPAVSNLTHGVWGYHYISLEKDFPKLSIAFRTLNDPPLGHDCDLYVRHDIIPTFTYWDYKDDTRDPNFVMTISNAKKGKWYLGVWAFQSCEYSITVTGEDVGCPAECSRHGTCSGSQCVCNTNFVGEQCENMTAPLSDGQVLSGFVAENSWNYYTYTPKDGQKAVVITVTQDNSRNISLHGDADLYVRRGGYPTRFLYDYIELSPQNTFSYTISDAVTDKLYIGVFGWSATGYTITVEQKNSCSSCVNGDCDEGTCVCKPGWAGHSCNETLTELKSNKIVSNSLASGKWHYYLFNSSKSTVVVSLKEFTEQSVGFLYLLIKEDETPSLTDYDYMDLDMNRGFHTTVMSIDNREGEYIDWIIGVYGSPYVNQPVNYQLVAWEPSS
eukprot:TRINITY_DN191_c7_g1_i1.p1 TRINITY_DN191_c7_g1~~TRINITY_DN191_c7_g1_i1.p1  ORF type:complete len:584 (-),score=76.02 TRINITY_DN191_c7_g1_i1:920-2671(-)